MTVLVRGRAHYYDASSQSTGLRVDRAKKELPATRAFSPVPPASPPPSGSERAASSGQRGALGRRREQTVFRDRNAAVKQLQCRASVFAKEAPRPGPLRDR